MRPLRDVQLITQHVSPEHTTEFAAQWMKELDAKALLVRGPSGWIAMITAHAALAAPHGLVGDVMIPLEDPLDADMSIRAATLSLGGRRQQAAPVASDGTVIGLVTFSQLIDELDRSYDPLTGLPWSDRLRDWGAKMLANGREISIVFFDLNDFGQYNKRHGHIVGDRVIVEFVRHISRFVHPSRDLLVRYGGDEFALVSLRNGAEAELLGREISAEQVHVEGVEEPVGFAVGVSGGKRSTERTAVHYAATIDNLISLASKNCLANKPKSKHHEDEEKEDTLLQNLQGRLENSDLVLQDAIYQLKPNGQRVVTIIAKGSQEGTDSAVVVTRPLGEETETQLFDVLSKPSE